MAPHVLGQRVHHDVRPELDRLHQHRRGHGVVHYHGHPVGVRHRRDDFEVGDVAGRVTDGLAEDCRGPVVDQGLQGGRTVIPGKPDLDTQAGEGMREERVGAAVEQWYRDDVVAGLGDRQDRVVDGGLPRAEREGRKAPFQRRDTLLEHVVRRVHDPRVDVPRHHQVEEIGAMLGIVELIGDGLVNGYRYRFRCRIGGIARMHCQRFILHSSLIPR